MKARRGVSLFRRLALILVLGLVVMEVTSHVYYSHETMVEATSDFCVGVARQALTLKQLIAGADDSLRASIFDAFSSDEFHISVSTLPPLPPANEWRHADEVTPTVIEFLTEETSADTVFFFPVANVGHMARFSRRSTGQPHIELGIDLGDGQWLNVRASSDVMMAAWSAWGIEVTATTGLALALVVLLALWAMRQVTRPVSMLAEAAERLGRDVNAPPIPESGPQEVRNAAQAFNEMQTRIRQLVQDRTQMLAAISHDLRTMLTRLKLRAEYIEDESERGKAVQDIDDMTSILNDTLAFAREEATTDNPQTLDLASLLITLVDDYSDMGHAARYDGPDRLNVSGHPPGLKRAFTNLIDNAVRYGDVAKVSLKAADDGALVVITDEGPGIPEDARESVFEPFVRLEESRSRATGGTGLGLAVARSIVHRHGGEIRLGEAESGGLEVTVRLSPTV